MMEALAFGPGEILDDEPADIEVGGFPPSSAQGSAFVAETQEFAGPEPADSKNLLLVPRELVQTEMQPLEDSC